MKKLKTKQQFKEAISYLKESTKYIYFSIIIFILSAILGFALKDDLSFLNRILEELISKTIGLNMPELTVFILQNNLQSAFYSVATGIFLGIFPIISILTNGLVIGYVLGLTADAAGFLVWWRLLPHGIFELPAIFISFGLGIKWGEETLKNYFNIHKKNKQMKLAGVLIILFLFVTLIGSLATASPLNNKINSIYIISFIFTALLLILVILFFTLFVFNKKMRKFQKNKLYNSANVMLMIIIPLLIIAALIEGLLIAVLG